MKLFFHIGGSKCASSSIQHWLTHNPVHERHDGQKNLYVVVNRHGELITSDKISANIHHTMGYADSFMLVKKDLKQAVFAQIKQLCAQYDSDTNFIFSSEGFLYKNNSITVGEVVAEFKKYRPELTTEVLLIIRPQTDWFNAAWFQWYAFIDQDFDPKAIIGTDAAPTWLEFITRWKSYDFVDKLTLKPLTSNIMKEFGQWLHIKDEAFDNAVNNQSLGENLSKFIIQNKKALNRTIHAPQVDFMFEKHLSADANLNGAKPFMLSEEKIAQIIEFYTSDNKEMLQYFTESDQEIIKNDPRWWDIKAYEDRLANIYNPASALSSEIVNDIAVSLTKLSMTLSAEVGRKQNKNRMLQSHIESLQQTIKQRNQLMHKLYGRNFILGLHAYVKTFLKRQKPHN